MSLGQRGCKAQAVRRRLEVQCSGLSGSGFRVHGLGFRVLGFRVRFRVHGLGFRVLGFRVHGLGFRV